MQTSIIWTIEDWNAKESKLDPEIIITTKQNPENIKHKKQILGDQSIWDNTEFFEVPS